MDALGLNPVLLIAQIISFLFMFWVLNKFLYKKLRESLEKRRESIHKISLNEQSSMEKIKELEEERLRLEKENQGQIRVLLSKAEKDASELKKELSAKALEDSKKILSEAKEQIEIEKRKAREELKSEAAVLAREMAEKVLLNSSRDEKSRRAQIEDTLSELSQKSSGKKNA